MTTDYLTTADVLGLHRVLMQRYGGTPGLRDAGALESALFRPQTGYYEDIISEAALQIHEDMMQMLESGTFDLARLEPWLRSFASPDDR